MRQLKKIRMLFLGDTDGEADMAVSVLSPGGTSKGTPVLTLAKHWEQTTEQNSFYNDMNGRGQQ